MKRILALAFVCGFSHSLLAQTPPTVAPKSGKTVVAKETLKTTDDPDGQKRLMTQRRILALGLIEQTAAEAPKWDNKQTAVKVLADAADFFWDEDAAVARGWLLKAWSLTDVVEEKTINEEARQFWRNSERSKLRTSILAIALKRDKPLAEKLLQKLNEQNDEDKSEPRSI